MGLAGKVALVTGASKGIGEGIAVALGREGATVVVNYLHDAAGAEHVRNEIASAGGSAMTLQADVVNWKEVNRMMQEIIDRYRRIDILVNNAGGKIRAAPFLELDEDLWDACINLNLKGTFLCSQAAARQMIGQRSGRIININTIAAIQAQPERAHYSAAKAGTAMLSKSMALELAPYHITVNTVGVTYVKTKATSDVIENHYDALLAMHPLGRLASIKDVSALVLFFASDQAEFVTGQFLLADGGHTLGRRWPF